MKSVLFAIAGLLLSTWALASEAQEEKLVEYVWVRGELSEIAKESQAVVTLSAEEIKALPVRNLVDLLSLLPGVHLSRKGPMGAAFDISLRGSNFEQTLIMIDGVPWNNPQTGHFNANLPVNLDDIASLQLIRGGNGARFGSAFAGAVNIVTRNKPGLKVALQGGEHGLFSAAFSAGVALTESLNLHGSLSHNQSDGFHPGREINNQVYSGTLVWDCEKMAFSATLSRNNKEFGAAGFYAPYPSWEESDATLFNLNWRLKGKGGVEPLRLTLSYQDHWDYFELDRNRPDFFRNQSSTVRTLLMAESGFQLDRLTLRLGGDLSFDRMESLAMGEPKETNASFFLNGKWEQRRLSLDWGLRGEWWQERSPWLVYYAGLSYQPHPAWVIKASVGRSARKPSFTERFYISPSNRGDERLNPEFSQNTELSLLAPRRFGLFEFAVFVRNQRGSIDWVKRASIWQAVNLEPYSVRGFEFSYSTDWGKTRLGLGLERLWSAGAPGVGYASKYGFRVPDWVVRANGYSSIGRALSLSWVYQFKRLMASSETAHLLDIQLQYRLSDALSLLLVGQNLGNELMEEIEGVRIAGRWFSAGIRFGL